MEFASEYNPLSTRIQLKYQYHLRIYDFRVKCNKNINNKNDQKKYKKIIINMYNKLDFGQMENETKLCKICRFVVSPRVERKDTAANVTARN